MSRRGSGLTVPPSSGGARLAAGRDVILAVVWIGVIYATIPFAVPVLRFLGSNLGGDQPLGILVSSVLFGGFGAILWKLFRRPGFGLRRGAWAALTLAGYGYYMWTIQIPAEKIHFIEFGILVVFVFHAVRHWANNSLAFLQVIPICFMVGLSDEYVQSLVPQRVGEFADVYQWDLPAILLSLVTLAWAWVPAGLADPVRRWHIWVTAALWSAAALAAAVFIQALSDFGHRHVNASIDCSFNSAFSPDELSRVDGARGAGLADLIDRSADTDYETFLSTYTARRDPYTHEARVHLFRRDRYLMYHAHYSLQNDLIDAIDSANLRTAAADSATVLAAGPVQAVFQKYGAHPVWGPLLQRYMIHSCKEWIQKNSLPLSPTETVLAKYTSDHVEKILNGRPKHPEDERIHFLHVSVMENRILETCFPSFLIASRRHHWKNWTREAESLLAALMPQIPPYESAVGKNMITTYTLLRVWLISVGMALIFLSASALLSMRVDR